jgi:transcriptional regulator with XRE-family HTH domain
MNKLRYLRFLSGKSLDALAKEAGISQSKASRAERGFAKLSEDEKKAVALALGFPVEDVFSEK